MIALAAAFSLAGFATGGAFLASYAAENGLPFDLAGFFGQRRALAAVPPAPVWCERTRRWRDPVTRAFVKAPQGRAR